MAVTLCGSSDEAQKLQQQLRMCQNAMRSKNQILFRQMENVERTCHDDSLPRMQGYLLHAIDMSQKFCTTLDTLCETLTQYRDLLNDLYINTEAAPQVTSRDGSREYQVSTTKQKWHVTDNGIIYDSPDTAGKSLNTAQYKSELGGSCGLCCCQNVGILSGKALEEMDVYRMAFAKGLCSKEGGTSAAGIASILTALGIPSHCEPMFTPSQLAANVMNGKGVIVSVIANDFYHLTQPEIELHAVTVTSVKVDKKGRIEGFYICDSNADALGKSGGEYYSKEDLWAVLSGNDVIVTDGAIR